MKQNPYEINYLAPYGVLAEMGVEIGDRVVSINDNIITDDLDIYFNEQDTELIVKIEKENGEIWDLEIEKDEDEELGIVNFDQSFGIRRCKNHCIFCFIDQMPPGMRQTLYIKDDDERLSFLQGNYVTLTNLSDALLQRIVKYHIMPINISVHTTDPELRIKMLKNPNAGKILRQLNYFYENNIQMNGQIVLCPGINDGNALIKTLKDLSSFYPAMQSVSVVPVGLSAWRSGLTELKSVDKKNAIEILTIIKSIQNEMMEKWGTHFVYGSDELYLLAEEKIPEADFYEDFSQIENGVGMIADFYSTLQTELSHIKYDNIKSIKFGIITGILASGFMKKCCAEISKSIPQLRFEVFSIRNSFFGENITVSGLITGKDIMNQISKNNDIDCFLMPENMVKYQTDILLDDISITDIEKHLTTKVFISPIDGERFINKIMEICKGEK